MIVTPARCDVDIALGCTTILPPMPPPEYRFTWLEADTLTRKVAEAVRKTEFMPDLVVGIARGGCVPAVHLSHLLGVRPFSSLLIQTTTSNEAYASRLASPRIVHGPELQDLSELRILIIDDAASTGVTIGAARKFAESKRAAEVRCAVLAQDTTVTQEELAFSRTQIDYLGTDVNAWAILPWHY